MMLWMTLVLILLLLLVFVPLLGFIVSSLALALSFSLSILLCALLVLLLLACVFFIPPVRRFLFIPRLIQWVKRVQPQVSETERAVIESGGKWWELEFFSSDGPDWQAMMSLSMTKLTSTEQDFLNHQVMHLCSMLTEWQINHQDKDLPKEAWEYIRREKFWVLSQPTSVGGLGFSALAHAKIVAMIASISPSAAYTVMVPNSLGPAELIAYYGTDQQKQYWLPRFCDGSELGCFGLTSLDAGSDAAAMQDKGEVCYAMYHGEKTLGVRLNFSKRYITLAPRCQYDGFSLLSL